MSVRVELEEVRDQVAACRSHPYLLTMTEEGRPHAVSLAVQWEGDELVGAPGPRTTGNAERSPEVSLLWPQAGRDGYALIVDGRAEVRMNGDAAAVAVKPTSAVLHKTPDAEGPGCIAVFNH